MGRSPGGRQSALSSRSDSEADRTRFIMKALNEVDVPYYRLPAAVALGYLDQKLAAAELRAEIRTWLFETIEHADKVLAELGAGSSTYMSLDAVIAERATNVLPEYMGEDDARRLVPFLGHRSECVRNNVLFTLVDMLGKRKTKRLVKKRRSFGSNFGRGIPVRSGGAQWAASDALGVHAQLRRRLSG